MKEGISMIDDSYESEYEQQLQEQSETEPENETKEKSISEDSILEEISGTLQHIEKQLNELNELLATMPKQAEILKKANDEFEEIASNINKKFHDDCLAEHRKVLESAGRNYNKLQKATKMWHQSLESEHESMFKWMKISSILTPILILLLFIFSLTKS